MRTALIAAHKRAESGQLRSELMLSGRSVLEWQAQLALDLGCERIICLCERTTEAVLSLQSWVEAQGYDFHAIRGNLQLVGLIRSEDELLMIADGLIPDAELSARFTQAGKKRGIATLHDDHPLPQQHPDDFERIDRDRHWAGVALVSADQVHKLGDLPPDHNAISLLLRLSLQAGEPCRALDLASSDNEKWQIASGSEDLAKRELVMIDAAVPGALWAAPSTSLASKSLRAIGARFLQYGAEASLVFASFFGAGALALAGIGYPASALAAGAVAAFSARLSTVWSSMRSKLWSKNEDGKKVWFVRLAVEIILTVVLGVLIFKSAGSSAELAFPVLAIGLSYLASIGKRSIGETFWTDRPIHMLAFAIAAYFGALSEALGLFAIGALMILLLRKNET